nr:uncharacterized protein LOC127348380 isoform X1 [Lolium perenne]
MLLPSTSLNKLQPGKRSGSRSTHPAMAAARPMNGELPVSLPEVLPPATSSDHLSMLLPGTSPNKLQPGWRLPRRDAMNRRLWRLGSECVVLLGISGAFLVLECAAGGV